MKQVSRWLMLLSAAIFHTTAIAGVTEYTLVIDREPVNITGKTVERITVNGGIPGPIMEFTEGDEAVIHVVNKLDEPTSVHWHGLLLPPEMDGVPGLGGYDAIKPGETFTYRFPLRQNGTYWYHAHSQLQEQDGHYGALVVYPKGEPVVQADRDYVVLLSDFSNETGQQILANIKKSPHYYNYSQRTVGDFFSEVREHGLASAWQDVRPWGQMRMSPTDLADVRYDAFLVNGQTNEQNWTGLFKPGERVRLRFINASAMSMYDVRIPGLQMTVVQADGQYVEPVTVDEFRFAVAETYDVIVTPQADQAYTIAAESIDRTGFALGTLAPREGMKGLVPAHRPRSLLTMADMGHDMDHGDHQMKQSSESMDHSGHDMHGDDHQAMQQGEPAEMKSGWADASTPEGHKALEYSDLRALGTQTDLRSAEREIVVTLGGTMERFIWTLNGHKFGDPGFEPIKLNYGERVRLIFKNETMMAHPMHLHGMFVQLENGQPGEKLPNKHTVNVAPGTEYSVLLTADEPGEWAFHCHLLYHMSAGMMSTVVVAEYDDENLPASQPAQHDMGGHHDHH
ncbi:copper resistance system multicopper oxidase [uncultured Methylophaga sp.]|uniref:copper resistance system multicopper oxidase n=1 Tax=uncultured Methylophaga sp. TaxID=285271 RepID=UPI0030D8E154|tara:strand:+ start:6633 stop:8333 length:1701 start_codon:yes stop_codon:yes gene_type:complete